MRTQKPADRAEQDPLSLQSQEAGRGDSVHAANAAASLAVQRRLAGSAPVAKEEGAVQKAAHDGTQGSGGPLPYLDRIQSSFGRFDVSSVRAFQGEPAKEANRALGAEAYASDNTVAFGGLPTLHTAAHEAAHVVQQRQGVHLKGGVGEAGDEHEQHADQVAERVTAGRSAEDLLAAKAGPGAEKEKGGGGVQLDDDRTRQAGPLSREKAAAAVRYNTGKRLKTEVWAQIARVVGAPSPTLGEPLVQKIAAWQGGKGLDADGCCGDITMQWLSQEAGGDGLDELVKSEKITFLGLNPDSKNVELATLKRAAGADNVTGLTGSDKQDQVKLGGAYADLNTEEGLRRAMAQLPNLSADKAQQLTAFIQASGEGSKDELYQLVAQLWNGERGKGLMKRLVISGHSWGSSVWGDNNGSIPFPHLERLTRLFPIAAGQVEDLMFSACNTAQIAKLDQYHRMFPNLKSIWGYAGYSPSAGTGSTRHIGEWEKGSRGHDSAGVDKGREKVNQGSGPRDQNVAVWSEAKGYKTQSHYAEMSYGDLRSAVDRLLPIYDQAFAQGVIDKSQLDQLQTLLQNMTGMHADALGGELERFQQMNARTLYLRHWPNITKNFAATHRAKLEAGYRDAGQTLPNFAGMPRNQVLEQIRSFTGAVKGDASREAAKLLTEILRDLDQNQIPDTWN